MKRSKPPRLESEAVPGADGGVGAAPWPRFRLAGGDQKEPSGKVSAHRRGRVRTKVIVLPFQIELVELKVQHLVGLLQSPPGPPRAQKTGSAVSPLRCPPAELARINSFYCFS